MNPILFVLYVIIPAILSIIFALLFASICEEYSMLSMTGSVPYNFDEIRNTLAVISLLALYFLGATIKGYHDLRKEEKEWI